MAALQATKTSKIDMYQNCNLFACKKVAKCNPLFFLLRKIGCILQPKRVAKRLQKGCISELWHRLQLYMSSLQFCMQIVCILQS
jgi:hypothetical protein